MGTLRRLLPGLLLAIAMHWAALDFWRGQGMFAPAQQPSAAEMQVSISEAVPPAKARAEAPPASPSQLPTKVAPTHTPVPVVAELPEPPVEQAVAGNLSDAGFRDMNLNEALVFYRIGLARGLDPLAWGEAGPAKLLITLDSHGAADAWRFEDGRSVPPEWAMAIRAVEVPGVLKGRTRDIELEISD